MSIFSPPSFRKNITYNKNAAPVLSLNLEIFSSIAVIFTFKRPKKLPVIA